MLGHADDLALLGYVRNTVRAGEGYPWPVPLAHLVVYRTSAGRTRVAGTWVPLDDPGELADRHWWPLASAGTSPASGHPRAE